MVLFKFFTFCVILHSTTSTSLDISADVENSILTRALRDITGQYHPELHGDHAHEHTIGLGHEVPPTLSLTYVPPSTGYTFPPPPPPTGGTPNGYANCGCELKGRCAKEVLIRMVQLLAVLKNDVVCGETEYELCCPDDPWAGQIDIFKPLAECRPVEHCTRVYGTIPTDVQDFGVIGPCLGLGSVRCLDGKPLPPPGPISIIVPIVDYNPPPPTPPVYIPPPPPVVYEPPPTPPPVVYQPPVIPPTVPTTVYEPPVVPPTVYEPPVTYVPPPPVPPVVYEAPVTVYEPPAPVITYEPPTTYEAPVTTYESTYEPPIQRTERRRLESASLPDHRTCPDFMVMEATDDMDFHTAEEEAIIMGMVMGTRIPDLVLENISVFPRVFMVD
ncbi:hypothetical protein Ocin01_17593 [Orchesella cincta]|uniref:Uncharacterized protein n=1 Tax=Orchesella cincta TaxID=48709 RepID=A0A1D2M7Y1_ORCCI|nr:hypothetical protein Ocin01_17593 [Orchesella cincta]